MTMKLDRILKTIVFHKNIIVRARLQSLGDGKLEVSPIIAQFSFKGQLLNHSTGNWNPNRTEGSHQAQGAEI